VGRRLIVRTTFFKGIVLGSVVSVVTVAATAAMAGTGVGGVFNLGKSNSVNAQTGLTGSTNSAQIQVTNNGTGASASGLGVKVASGKPPLVVNSTTKVANLNADLLDGLDSRQLQQTVWEGCGQGTAIADVDATGSVTCTKSYEVPISANMPVGDAFFVGLVEFPGTLRLELGCSSPKASFVDFSSLEPNVTTLNWLWSNGSVLNASGANIAADSDYPVYFTNSRIEGQFIWSDPGNVVTINLHAVQTAGGCQINGTANVVETS
jgi:hypothetical protein